MKGFRYLKDVTTLNLDWDTCIGCGRCLEVCPHQVFSLAAKKAFSGTGMPAWSAGPVRSTARSRPSRWTPGSAVHRA
jgi:ferredoxin